MNKRSNESPSNFNESSNETPTLTETNSTSSTPSNSKVERLSHFTGHSKVLYLSGLESSSSTTKKQLDSEIRPWQWSCPIPRLRILLMVVGTRFVSLLF